MDKGWLNELECLYRTLVVLVKDVVFISEYVTPTKPSYSKDGLFFSELRRRVDAYFGTRSRRDDPRIYRKTLILFTLYGAAYLALMSTATVETSVWIQVLLLCTLGFTCAALGFNCFHDSIHGSFSANSKINRFVAFISCSMIGASRLLWYQKHNVLHHQYPNIYEWDDDLETRNNLRLSPHQPWLSKFKYQHLYFPFIYALTTLEWLFVKDFAQYFSQKINSSQKTPKFTSLDHLEFWVSKLIYFSFFVVIPLFLFSIPQYLVGLLIMHVSLSWVLAAVFQPAHVMEEASFSKPDPAHPQMTDEWAVYQMKTSVNFAPKNSFLNWFSGGLNYQVEHHLFPLISHTHYPELSEIVKKTAAEYQIPYHSHPSYFGALRSHVMMLHHLSKVPETQPASSIRLDSSTAKTTLL